MDNPQYEQRDIQVRVVVRFLLGIAGALVLVSLSVLALLHWFGGHPSFTQQPTAYPPAPVLQAHPRVDLERYRAQETQLLESAAWLDRERSTARIPIRDAMKLVVAHGADAGPGLAEPKPQTPTELQRLKASSAP